MVKVIQGDRVGKQGKLTVVCSAVIFDEDRQRVLLTQRQDNGRWCLPGGHMEAGESAAEACLREVWEETGLSAQIDKLLSVYSSPNRLYAYPDGNICQMVGLCFIAHPIAGELQLSNETTAFGYFTQSEMESMDIMEPHIERIQDAFIDQQAAFVR